MKRLKWLHRIREVLDNFFIGHDVNTVKVNNEQGTFKAVLAGAMKAMAKAGYHLPDDMSFIGFDDCPICEWTSPALTTVRLPREHLGEEAVRLLIRMLNGEPGLRLKVEINSDLMERESVLRYALSTKLIERGSYVTELVPELSMKKDSDPAQETIKKPDPVQTKEDQPDQTRSSQSASSQNQIHQKEKPEQRTQKKQGQRVSALDRLSDKQQIVRERDAQKKEADRKDHLPCPGTFQPDEQRDNAG